MKAFLCWVLVGALVCVQPVESSAEPRPGARTFRTARSIHVKVNDQFGNSVDTHAAWSAVHPDVLEEYYSQVMSSISPWAPPPTILVLESHKDQIQRIKEMSRRYKKPAKLILVPDGLYEELAQSYPVLGSQIKQTPLFGITPGSRKIFIRPTRSDWYVGGIVTCLGAFVSYSAMVIGGDLDPEVIFKVLAFHTATVSLFQIFHSTLDNLFEFRFGFSKNAVSRKEQLFYRIIWETFSKSMIRGLTGAVGSAHALSTDLGKIEIAQNITANALGGIPYYLTRNQIFKHGDLRSEARRLWWGVNAYLPALFLSFRDQMGQNGAIILRFHYDIGERINVYASTLEIVAFYLLGAGFLITFPNLAKIIADIEQSIFEESLRFFRGCGRALGIIGKARL